MTDFFVVIVTFSKTSAHYMSVSFTYCLLNVSLFLAKISPILKARVIQYMVIHFIVTVEHNVKIMFSLSGFFLWTCQWLQFPLIGLRAQSRVSPVVGLLPLASEPACLRMAFPPFLVKQLRVYRCDSVVISLFVRTGYTTRRWGWLLGRIGFSFARHWTNYWNTRETEYNM
jgi:hypothetical protein